MDLRSAITREASNAVRIMAQVMEDDFSSLAPKFMHEGSLFKLVSCATKIINEHGNLCCIAIINYCQEPKVIDNIFENLKNKSSNLRTKSSYYFYLILGSWPDYILDKYVEIFEQFFTTSISDPSSDCRHFTR